MYEMFLDESGDHNLNVIDPNHPVFASAGCIFKKDYYQKEVIKATQDLKLKYFNSDTIILHSRDIRKQETQPFLVLRKKEARESFYKDLNYLFSRLDFTIIASIIDKHKLKKQYGNQADNPYYLSLGFIMERYAMFLRELGDTGTMIIESRNRVDDNLLYIAFSNFTRQRQKGFRRSY